MISDNDLVEEFGEGKTVGSNIHFFQEKMKSFIYNYWVSRSAFRCLLIVSKDTIDHVFCGHVFAAAPQELSFDRPTIFELSGSGRDFTHVLAVPSTFHGYLNGVQGVERKHLILCIPIYRGEFSGDETPAEFKYMHPRLIPIWQWERQKSPKICVYFDNPATGGGTDESGALIGYSTLLREIDNLSGVVSGFIEITNWAGDVVEVLSPGEETYILIRDRKDEEYLNRDGLLYEINAFLE